MLAGNVNVFVDGGTLFVQGDGVGNGVSIQQLDTDRYAVIGFDINGGATNINGSATAKAFSGVVNDINVDLNGGPDVVVIGNKANVNQLLANEVSNGTAGTIPANPFPVNTATVTPTWVTVPRNLIINTDDGFDGVGLQVKVGRPNFGGVVNVQTGNGDDRVALQVVSAEDDVLINTNAGNDHVRLNVVAAFDFIFANLGTGNDSLRANNIRAGHSHLLGGDNNDSLDVQNAKISREFLLTGDAGNDFVRVNGSFANDLIITTAGGADRVTVSNFRVSNNATIDTGSQADIVTLNNLIVDDFLNVFLGSENDRLNVTNSSANDARLDGGSGFDTLFDGGGNSTNADIVNFEQFLS
jgi:hypothetical protein